MLAMVSGQVFRLVRKRNDRNSRLLQPSAQFLLSFSRAYLYYAYGAHVPFLCTSAACSIHNAHVDRKRDSLRCSARFPLNKDFPENSFQHMFWEEQRKFNALKNKRQMRWHPLIIRYALALKYSSTSAYRLVSGYFVTSFRENPSRLHPLVLSE